MKPSLADQLKNVKLDFQSYARLPIREDVLVMNIENADANKAILKQWEKLNYLRKHLQTIDRYIQSNKGETIATWLVANNTNLSQHVLDKIGAHNNETGGISAYFYNLQTFYDQEERAYDDMESKATMPNDLKTLIGDMRKERGEKNIARKATRKIKVKDMKADGKGYLTVVMEEPVVAAADAKPEVDVAPVVDAVKSAKSNIGIWIGGGLIVVTAIAMYVSSKKEG